MADALLSSRALRGLKDDWTAHRAATFGQRFHPALSFVYPLGRGKLTLHRINHSPLRTTPEKPAGTCRGTEACCCNWSRETWHNPGHFIDL